jgi:aspartate racemase
MMISVEFAEIEALQHQDRWDEAAEILIDAAHSLESGGADFAIICTNTMHKLYDTTEIHAKAAVKYALANEMRSL